jgi:RHS repeat-associated protein
MVIAGFKPASGSGESTTVHYVHTDHLTGSNVVTGDSDAIEQTLDYYPYGSIRLNEKSGSFDEKKKFTGYEHDDDTGLEYANARYYNSGIGRFISQDPVFIAIGDGGQIKQLTQQELQQILADPQNLNSYSYSRNNPLRIIDPTGEWILDLVTGKQSWNSFILEVGDAANYLYDNSSTWKTAMDHPVAAGATVGIASGAASYVGAVSLTSLSVNYLGGAGTACIAFCGAAVQTGQKVIDYTSRFGPDLGSKMNQVSRNLSDSGYNFSDHSVKRIAERIGVGNERNVLNVLQNSKPFNYFHEGSNKIGYYDQASKMFVGKAADTGKITTIITNASKNYIKNLIK